MIVFYGAPASSAGRTHLMLEECGVPYEYRKVDFRDPASKADYAKVNPAGRVPFIIDGDFRLQESIAINFYLAEKYAPQLWSTDGATRAQIYAWSLWCITNLQPVSMTSGSDRAQPYLDELDAQLASGYVVGDKLTVADINVASVANLAAAFGAGTLGPNTQPWLAKLKARPTWQKVARGG